MPTRTRMRPPRISTKSGSTPNCVMVGPRLISTTRAGAPKEASVSSISLGALQIQLIAVIYLAAFVENLLDRRQHPLRGLGCLGTHAALPA